MKLVGRVPLRSLDDAALVRLKYPPFDVLITLVDGEPRALEDACNHAGASLSNGWLDEGGQCIVCPVHAYMFDLKTGRCVAPAGLCDDQRTFVTRVEGDDVLVYDPVEILITLGR